MSRPYKTYLFKQIEAALSDKDITSETILLIIKELEIRNSRSQSQKHLKLIKKCNEMLQFENNNLFDAEIRPINAALSTETTGSSDKDANLSVSNLIDQIKNNKNNPIKFELRPNFFSHFNGIYKLECIGNSELFSIKSEKFQFSFKYSDDVKINIRSGFFTSLINISIDEEIYSFRLNKAHAKILQKIINYRESIEKIYGVLNLYFQILQKEKYITLREIANWKISASSLINFNFNDIKLLINPIQVLIEKISSSENEIENKNKIFINNLKIKYQDFFDQIEKSPLTEKQIDAILCDETAILVNAGAGTGKTSTVVGKIAYLIHSKTASANQILALAYGKDAAKELRERVKDRLGVDVEVRTFHSFGKEIITKNLGHKLTISECATDEKSFHALIARFLHSVWQDPKSKKLVDEFISFHRYPARYREDFDSKNDYLKYIRKFEPRTLKGEKVKSFEELLIADWLYLNNISYEYEYPYKIQTATNLRRQYKPDFYLKDYDIYLEHFGIDKKGNTAPGINRHKYMQGINWKRNLHKENNTKLIETYSWMRKEGTLFNSLQEMMELNSVALSPFDSKNIREHSEINKIDEKLVSLLKNFLSVLKENQYSLSSIEEKIHNNFDADKNRALCFIEIFKIIYLKYEEYLSERKEIDFSDLIRISTDALSSGNISLNFTRVIVDEYQDISNGRYLLLNQIIKQSEDCRIMCVGDDWQSIYGFTGSDVEKSTDFSSFFRYSKIVPLDRTFRFTKPIIDLSSDFIQKNNIQIKKYLKGRDSAVPHPLNLFSFKDKSSVDICMALDAINEQKPKGLKWDVFLLGRYKKCEPSNIHELKNKYIDLNIEFLTIHASKGREANAVVILNIEGGKWGFPSHIESDPIMSLVIPSEDKFEFSEERRVMYVAMTRAKEIVCFLCRTDFPSDFFPELKQHALLLSSDQVEVTYKCISCEGRLLLKHPNRISGYSWRCENDPYCEEKSKMCVDCNKAPTSLNGNCMNIECHHLHSN